MGSLRIIAGDLKGRRIAVPEGRTVRPTSDRAREALFSMIGRSVAGARVLDAFAGTGALGLEALSRGAERATFVEIDRHVVEVLRANLESLPLPGRYLLLVGDCRRLLPLGGLGEPFDLVLADPPYGGGLAAEFLQMLSSPGLLSRSGSLVVLERETLRGHPSTPTFGDLRFLRVATYGRTTFELFGSGDFATFPRLG